MAKQKKTNLYDQFDEHLNKDVNQIRTIKQGDILNGIIVDKQPDFMVVDIGYKSEGIVAAREMDSEILDIEKLEPGDKILVYVVKLEDDGSVVLSIKRTDEAMKWLQLESAMEEKEVVEAKVVEFNNGGVICELGGEIRGFIPTSQLDPTRVYPDGVRQVGRDISEVVQRNLSGLVGEAIRTRISELDKEKNKIILSEKMLLQEHDIEKREKTLREIREGDILHGKISGITPFGVFVNASGLEGLVHLSELSWDKIERVEDLYNIGDEVDVQVIGIADNGKRIAYSIKRLQKDPWEKIISKYKVGDVVEGTVQKVVEYGAFVRIDKGLNGLIHISEISDKLVHDPSNFVKEGEDVEVKILSISSTERHLGLSLKAANKKEEKKSRISSSDQSSGHGKQRISDAEFSKKVESAIENEI